MRARLPLVVVLVALLGQVGLGWLACDALDRGLQAPPTVVAACADADGGAPGDPCEHNPVAGERSAGAVVRAALDVPPAGYVLARVSDGRDGAPVWAEAPPVLAAVRAPVAVLGVNRS